MWHSTAWAPFAGSLPPQARGMLCKPVPWPSAPGVAQNLTEPHKTSQNFMEPHTLCSQTPVPAAAPLSPQTALLGRARLWGRQRCWLLSHQHPTPRLPLSPQQNLSAFTDQPVVPEHLQDALCTHQPVLLSVLPAKSEPQQQVSQSHRLVGVEMTSGDHPVRPLLEQIAQ